MTKMADFDPAAERATLDWLALVDARDARASWAAAATAFRRVVPEQRWAESLEAARGPLGTVESRQLVDAKPATELPGAPDGQYVVFRFETAFEHKSAAVETVTPMLDADGEWRVSGYFVR
jgi:hypothetical protein